MKNTHVFHMWFTRGIGTITCDSHMIHTWTTCELKHIWITCELKHMGITWESYMWIICESHVNHMWLFQIHMWTTCVSHQSHVGFYICIFRKGIVQVFWNVNQNAG
jgi:hypothetical protein